MKFIHMADMHFDAPFTLLNSRSNIGEQRRLEQREIFKKIINYIKENEVEYLFISGDLYEHEYIRETTIKYINSLFNQIPQTKVYITPGNHDPYMVNSMYNKCKWSPNVYIFSNKIEIIESQEVDIYGFGFNNFYCPNSGIEDIQIKNKDKINILITHGTINGGSHENLEYNPLNRNKIKALGFDYVALGHIHKPDYNNEEKIVYPGSTISMGFDEKGKHGVILGEIDKQNLSLQFLQVDTKEFKEELIDVTGLFSNEELIEKINSLNIEADKFYELILIGKRNFEIDIYYLYKFINNENIIKIKNKTEINIEINKIAEENNLKGIFIKEILQEQEEGKIKKEIVEQIIEIGLDVLK